MQSALTTKSACANAAAKPLCGQPTRTAASIAESRLVSVNGQENGHNEKETGIRLPCSRDWQVRRREPDSMRQGIIMGNKEHKYPLPDDRGLLRQLSEIFITT